MIGCNGDDEYIISDGERVRTSNPSGLHFNSSSLREVRRCERLSVMEAEVLEIIVGACSSESRNEARAL